MIDAKGKGKGKGKAKGKAKVKDATRKLIGKVAGVYIFTPNYVSG